MTLALTAALTFTPIGHDIGPCPEGTTEMWNVCVSDIVRRWIPAEYGKEARHRNHTSGDVTAPPSGTERWRSLVAAYFPPEHVDRMLRIMACESGGDPEAKNPHSSATGLFQIMGFWQKAWPGDYTDPWTNVAVAYQIWLEQGYRAWVCKG